MREIKFRVLDKETGKVYPPEEIEHLFLRNGEVHIVSLRDIVLLAGEFELMQFTGLTDKNGKEVYDRDILGWKGRENTTATKAEVRWKDDGWVVYCFYVKDGKWKDYPMYPEKRKKLSHWLEMGVEVIGNVPENPELLEG